MAITGTRVTSTTGKSKTYMSCQQRSTFDGVNGSYAYCGVVNDFMAYDGVLLAVAHCCTRPSEIFSISMHMSVSWIYVDWETLN